MKFKKLIQMMLVLALLVCTFVACGTPMETDTPETDSPESNIPETDAPETDAPGECQHTEVDVEEVLSTCSTNGYRKETCKACGKLVVDTAYPKSACTPEAAATCTAASVCSVCGDELEAAKGHTFGEAVVVAATCRTEGSSTKTCSACNETVVETFAKKDHVLGAVTEEVVPTDCSVKGYRKGTCVTCNTEITVELTMAHTYVKTSFVIGEDGSIVGDCTACGQKAPMTLETMLKLDFENTDLQTEAEASPMGDAFTVHRDSNKKAVFAVDGERTVMAPTGPVFVDFDPTVFVGCAYYVVSFDFSYNAEQDYGATRPTLFSFVPGYNKESTIKGPASSWGNCLKLDTPSMRLGAVTANDTSLNERNSIPIVLGEWHNATIVVNNVTGERIVYLDGKYASTPKSDGVIDEAAITKYGGYFCFRFTDQVGNAPLIDNFNMYIVR